MTEAIAIYMYAAGVVILIATVVIILEGLR
jgi:hypothetical protein